MGESNMETYITISKIDSQWEFAVWLRKLKQVLWQRQKMTEEYDREIASLPPPQIHQKLIKIYNNSYKATSRQ